ncbi:MAG TPA: glycosyltransferase, partial [Candidatus Poseidoniaceae archaeon]
NPPDGWAAKTWQSHKVANPIGKYLHHKKMIKRFRSLISTAEKPDIVHIHTAADWSWKRKAQYVKLCKIYTIPCVVHIHSGKFSQWLGNKNSKNANSFTAITNFSHCRVVVLTKGWQNELSDLIGQCSVVNNPVDPSLKFTNTIRNEKQIAMLGRYGKVKGHEFAAKLLQKLRQEYDSEISMIMTGTDKFSIDGLECHEWLSEEEKTKLLESSGILIVPSQFEGQPMVMLEGMQFGMNCLVSDQIIDRPKLVNSAKYGDIDDWFNSVISILKNPGDKNDIKAVANQFNIVSINQQWRELYQSLSD